ncbi:MAG TPA: serine/threonine-protein kinase [Fimbriiglobus sp.]|jgi:serine/threonine protein kinase/Flp pilus assembly protein TadD|nr:serine/threonine-protein kinase [Fimbriiglobus sp.]
MPTPVSPAHRAELAHLVEAFEDALARDPNASPDGFLPASDQPLYVEVLAELVRVDLENAWAGGRPRRLAGYLDRYPALAAAPEAVAAVAFEEYRLRRLHGEPATVTEYAKAYGLSTSDWPSVLIGPAVDAATAQVLVQPAADTPPPGTEQVAVQPDLEFHIPTNLAGPADPSDAESVAGWVGSANAFPGPGGVFLGFRLQEELGRGAFGRVYLARQADLGGRLVALKVACDIFGESRTLAQFQHTNIVPIYSFHQAGPLQAVCMPFFGRTTLAQVVQQLSHRPSLPHSGRELRSTVNVGKASTLPSTDRPVPGPVAPAEQPAPAGDAADGWARLDGLSYVEAVLWLGAQLADGLSHAHDRGIVHRDLKPANVLLTDEGRPMLLDFNLAEDTKLRASPEGARMGGTLPYMAPEQIEAFRSRTGVVDGRCDLFALGVILYELLTGRHPFPVRRGASKAATDAMLADRRQPPPSLRRWNPAVTPAVEAIVRKCLAPVPHDRYQRADHLRDDIQRQLEHQPLKYAPDRSARERLRKWARRHPRLASSGAVAVVAAVLLVGVGASALVARERSRNLQAQATFADHRDALRDAQVFLDDRNQSLPRLDEGLARLHGVLDRYGIPDDASTPDPWAKPDRVSRLTDGQRGQLREDVAETFYRMAQVAALRATFAAADEKARQTVLADRWNATAARYGGDRLARAVREQRAAVADLRGEPGEPRQVLDGVAPNSASDHYLLGVILSRKGRHRDAIATLRTATQLDPENFSAWFVRGTAHLALEQNELAALAFGSCTALRKEFAPAWLNRGLAYARMHFHEDARADYDRAIELDPSLTEAYILRAGTRFALGDLKGAAADYDHTLETDSPPTRVYFLRADVRRRLGDTVGADADRTEGLRREPRDELSWIGRAENRLADPTAALADVEEALKLNPVSATGLQLKSHILAERLGRPDEAIAALNRAIEFHPDHAAVRAGRGVLLARLGRRDDAHRDARDALLRDAKAPNRYQVACIYALTAKAHPEDRREAFALLWSALKTGFGLDIVETDHDLDPIRKDPEFQRLVRSARAIQKGL